MLVKEAGTAPSAAVDAALSQLTPMAVLGGTVAELRRRTDEPETTVDQLVALIERDEGFAVNLLHFANSAAHGRAARASSVRQAVVLVGRDALYRFALEAETYRFFDRVGAGQTSRGQLHLHAIAVASCAVACAEAARVDTELVHLAALLHDVGKLVLPLAFGARACERTAHASPVGTGRAALERASFGIDHAHAGALLAERSGATAAVVRAIALHHGGAGAEPDSPTREVACVQVANAVVGMPAGVEPDERLLAAALRRLEFGEEVVDDLAQSVVAHPPTPAVHAAAGGRIAELERLANTDELTGLPNRRALLAHLKAALGDGEAGGLLLVDADRFKDLNDTLGHRAGDSALIAVARVISGHGFAGRLGGDEFAVWCPGELEQAVRCGELIVETIERLAAAGETPQMTVSIGVALAPDDGSEVHALLEAADRGLYQAKAGGRAQVARSS